MKIGLILSCLALVITACSSNYANTITFTPLFQDEEITVPGVSKSCSDKEKAEKIIRDFYTTDQLNGFDRGFVSENEDCFNDVLLLGYVDDNSQASQEEKEASAKEWIPSDYDISRQGLTVIEGFAQKFIKSGFKCAQDSEGCWGISVIARDGCQFGIYADMFFSDSAGNQKPEVREESTKAAPMQKMTLVFNTYDPSDQTARIWRVGCA